MGWFRLFFCFVVQNIFVGQIGVANLLFVYFLSVSAEPLSGAKRLLGWCFPGRDSETLRCRSMLILVGW